MTSVVWLASSSRRRQPSARRCWTTRGAPPSRRRRRRSSRPPRGRGRRPMPRRRRARRRGRRREWSRKPRTRWRRSGGNRKPSWLGRGKPYRPSWARTRDEAAAEQKRVVNAEVAKVRDEAERVLASSLADAQGAAVDTAASEARVTAERALADEIAQAREEARRGQQAALAAVSRLLDSVRRLDAQSTLTDVLDTLTELVAAEAGRVAVFVASDGEMRGWRLAGFGPEAGEARDRILNGADAGFLSRAIGTRQTRVLPAGGARTDADRPPAFTALPLDRSALSVPVLIGGETMGAGVRRRREHGEPVDPVAVVGRGRAARATRRAPPRGAHGRSRRRTREGHRAGAAASECARLRVGTPRRGSANREADEAARRYARLLVSEIKLYKEGAVTEGRAERDLGHRLKGEIDRARGLYEEAGFPPACGRGACSSIRSSCEHSRTVTRAYSGRSLH